MRRFVLLFAIAFSTPALAQQGSPSQVAVQVTTVVSQWAMTLEAQQKKIEELQKENADLKEKLGKGNAEQK